tara:strand:- start:1844 stop:2644 length:801 start_codon:yes stop_codon:yes gene_type:complete
MALVTPITTVNPVTGAPIYTITVASGDLIQGIALRRHMCSGAYNYNVESESLTVANGSISSIAVPNYNTTVRTGGATAAPTAATTIALTGLTLNDGSWFIGQKVQVFNATGSNTVAANATITALPATTAATMAMDAAYTSTATTAYELLVRPQTLRNVILNIESTTQTADTLYESSGFTISENILTLINPYPGNDKVTTISYDYFDTIPANLVYDVPVYPSNTMGTMTMATVDLILWNEGILAQSFKCWDTSGTLNGVVSNVVTDA